MGKSFSTTFTKAIIMDTENTMKVHVTVMLIMILQKHWTLTFAGSAYPPEKREPTTKWAEFPAETSHGPQ